MADNDEITVVRTERLDLGIFTDTSFLNKTLIDSPERINNGALNEFTSGSKPVYLITLNRKRWAVTINSFDNEFIHVVAPQGFKIFIGDVVIVEFQTGKSDFIIQTVQHKYAIQKTADKTMSPVLTLKYLDPRMDKRYTVPPDTSVHINKIDHNAIWVTDSKYFVVRSTGYKAGNNPDIIVQETIGFNSGSSAGGAANITYLDKEMNELRSNMIKTDIINISAGGCAIMLADRDMKQGSLLFLTITTGNSDTMQKLNKFDFQLFAIVRNTMPAEGGNCKYGIKFIKRLDNNTLNRFLNYGQPV